MNPNKYWQEYNKKLKLKTKYFSQTPKESNN